MSRPLRRRAARVPPAPRRTAWFALDATAASGARWTAYAGWAVIAAYGVAALAIALGPHRVGDVFTETDFYGSYGPGALALARGHLDPSRYAVVGPVYEATLALVSFVARDLFLAAQLVSVAAMVATLLLWRSLLERRSNGALALGAIAVLATNAQFFRYGWAATTDSLALALQAATLWTLLGAREATVPARRAWGAGALAAAAFLTRYTAVVLVPLGLVAILAGWSGAARGRRRAHALGFAAAFALPVAPWLAFSLAHGGALAFQLHQNIAYEVFARPKGIVWDVYERDLEPQFPTPWSVLARDPGAVLARLAWNVVDHLRLDAARLTGWPIAACAAAGVALAARDGALARLRGVWLAGALAFLALVPAFHSERYSLAVLPAWAALAGAAFASPRLALAVGPEGRRAWLKAALALVPLGLTVATTIAFTRGWLSQLPVETRVAARAVAPLVRPGDRVMARKPHFAWYAGLEPVAFPLVDSLPQLADAARREHARWLYYSWPEAELRPSFEWLLDTSAVVPGLAVRAVVAKNPAVVYEIGPGFGTRPAWLANDTLATLHRMRARRSIFTTDVDSRLFLALYARQHGRPEEAETYLDELVAVAPGVPGARLLRADNLTRLGRLDEATRAWDDAERLAPGAPEIALGRGWVALLSGDPRRAAALWAPVVAATGDPATLARMAQTFDSLGDAAALAAARARLRAIGARE